MHKLPLLSLRDHEQPGEAQQDLAVGYRRIGSGDARRVGGEIGLPLVGLKRIDALIRESGEYAEAYNQRAVLYYRMGNFQKAIVDLQQVLKLNPHHFGAAAGMGQCYVRLRKPRAALRAFKSAYRINPNLDDVKEAIQSLEEVLGER